MAKLTHQYPESERQTNGEIQNNSVTSVNTGFNTVHFV